MNAESDYQLLGDVQLELLKKLSVAKSGDVNRIAEQTRNFLEKFYFGSDPTTGEIKVPSGGMHLGINVNDECNLKCRHCYYANTHEKIEKIGYSAPLTADEWERVIDNSVDSGLQRFSIMGKFSRKLSNILFLLKLIVKISDLN